MVQIICNVTPYPDSTSPVVITPYKLDLSQFTDVPVTERVFELRNVTDRPVRPMLTAAPLALLEVELPDVVPARATAEARVRLTTAGISTTFQKSITIEFDDDDLTRFSIPIKRSIRLAGAPTLARR